jgi:hypothetical protein
MMSSGPTIYQLLFEPFKNPDGKTYNGVAFMAALTGLPEEEIRAEWEKVKKNKSSSIE